jgi:prepilin-type N-terminal cleavage/methylation domain-containing protein
MTKTFSSKKSAFSLIELSIVLIVIGLLIAGITGGASLIKSSELRSVMGEARSYAVGVNAFYTQYNALPGDYATAIGTSKQGNGNNKIEYISSATASSTLTAFESSNAWLVLRNIGAIDGISNVALDETTTAKTVTFGSTSAANAPSSKVKSSGWAFDYRTLESTDPQNVVVLTSSIGTSPTTANTLVNGTNVATAAISPSDALSIDAKIDDNVPDTGKVRGLNAGGLNCYATSAYTTATTTKTCGLTYQVDVNS